ncbi:hypothetical protein GF322_03595 [Candidatus Dependentiae bacterium]|nr:hypothetical protein [Candidatus Dependentiae bacterium]
MDKEQKKFKKKLSLLVDQEQKSKILNVQFKKFIYELKKNCGLDITLSSLKKNNMECLHLEPKKNDDKNFYCKKYYVLNAKGLFKDAVLFLNELEKNIMGIKFKSIEFERKKNNKVVLIAKFRFLDFEDIKI